MRLLLRLKEMAKDSVVYGMSQVLTQLIGFLLLPLYTHYLSPNDYGVLAMLSLLPLLFPTLVNLGLNNAVFRFYRKCTTETERLQLIGTAHLIVVVISTVVVGIMLLFSPILNEWLTDGEATQLTFILALCSAWCVTLGTIPLVVLKQQRKVISIAVRSLVGLLLNVLITIWLVVFMEWGVLGSVIGTLAGNLISMILILVQVGSKAWGSFSSEKAKPLLVYSVPFVPYFLFAVLMGSAGQYLVKNVLGLEQAGYYSIAWRFSTPLVMILNAFNNSWAAFKFDIRYKDKAPEKSFRDIFSVYILMISISWLLMALWMPHILRWTADERFYEAAYLIPIMLLIPIAQHMRGMLATGFEMSESPKWAPLITLVGFLTLGVSSVFLVTYGVLGIIFSVMLGWAVTAIVTFIYSQSVYYIRYNWRLFAVLFITTFLIWYSPFLLNDFLKSLVGIALCVGWYFLFERYRLSLRELFKF